MNDGAHMGVGAHRALKTILGGDPQPEAQERMTPQQMEAHLRSATTDSYDGTAAVLGRCMLDFMLAHPRDYQRTPAEDVIDLPDGRERELPWSERWEKRTIRVEGFASIWQGEDPEGYRHAMDQCDPTGFMFGWAYNAARYCAELPPVGNPALLTIKEPPSA